MTDSETLFSSSQSWAIDQQEVKGRSQRIAWVVACFACGVALVEAVALVVLLPLKTTTPVMLLVDRTTGYVQSIDPASAQTIRVDDALLQSLLAQYVSAREGFDRATVKAAYRRAALWSSGAARTQYMARMADGSSASPFNRYRSSDVVGVEVKSVSRIAPNTALVRFDTILTSSDGRDRVTGSWISTLRYRFSDAAMSYDDRLANPLGLQVFSYRRESERPERAIRAEGRSSPVDAENDESAEAPMPAPENAVVGQGREAGQ